MYFEINLSQPLDIDVHELAGYFPEFRYRGPLNYFLLSVKSEYILNDSDPELSTVFGFKGNTEKGFTRFSTNYSLNDIAGFLNRLPTELSQKIKQAFIGTKFEIKDDIIAKYQFPTSVSLLLNIFDKLPATHKPLIPFMLLKYITSTHLDIFLNTTLDNLGLKENNEYNLMTSCVYSTYANLLVLTGSQSTKKICNLMKIGMYVTKAIPIETNETYDFKMESLFDGELIRHMNINKEIDFDLTKANNYTAFIHDNFCKSISDPVEKCVTDQTFSKKRKIDELDIIFENANYDFNATTITAMKDEIKQNKDKVSQNNTIVYTISINDSIQFGKGNIEHVFLLEQFFSKIHGEIRYRIYQSWIGQATLLDDFHKRLYGEFGENSWNEKEKNDFLDKFQALYCKNNKSRKAAAQECFGYKVATQNLLFFKDQTLSGVIVRYISTEIDPKQCPKHFMELVNSNPELKSAFGKNKCDSYLQPIFDFVIKNFKGLSHNASRSFRH